MNNHERAYTFVYTIAGNKLVMTEVEGTEDSMKIHRLGQ